MGREETGRRDRTIKDPPETKVGYFAEVSRLNEMLEKQMVGVHVPKRVVEATEGVLEGIFLKYWWVTPNSLIWHRDGVYEKSPQEVWNEGFPDYVIQFIWAMQGSGADLARRAVAEGKKRK